ncbi:nucleolar and coiled-body phosphoprotein 1 [Cucurbita pepo subsp. pepo]|uniref:nucleolar and coiled-body phosphoprotein 1 n=1 Tax=Cucurbita pepo subsp. pepo TaxID=3664 RepID=UPI000C9D5C5B|nr:nucleolar and coiled-body phosphoprotein 1 [Cucurbita pepo subsp. pepo]
MPTHPRDNFEAFPYVEGDSSSKWSPAHSPPVTGKDRDPEEDIDHHQKKSVFAKVKEKAKKLRYTLSHKKKHGEDENATPSWGYNLDENEEEEEDHVDAEYLGAPMYESELAPEGCKENARQHPRANPVIAENHVLANNINLASGQDEKPFTSSEMSSEMIVESSLGNIKTGTETAAANTTIKRIQEMEAAKPSSPSKTLTEAVTEKLAPVYSTVTDATHALASKIQSLTFSAPLNPLANSSPATPKDAFSPATQKRSSSPMDQQASRLGKGTEQIWDKGDSVKEYLMQKFEPGEDERALSEVLFDALSPGKLPGDVGVVEKMREAVSSMLQADEAPQPVATHLAEKSLPRIETAPQPVASQLPAKSLPLAENSPKPVVATSSLRAETTPQPAAAKQSLRTKKTPEPVVARFVTKPSLPAKEAPQAILALHLPAKPSSQAKESPQALLATRLAAKPSLPEATPQPMITHLGSKHSSSAPIFTTTHMVAEEEDLERILQAN